MSDWESGDVAIAECLIESYRVQQIQSHHTCPADIRVNYYFGNISCKMERRIVVVFLTVPWSSVAPAVRKDYQRQLKIRQLLITLNHNGYRRVCFILRKMDYPCPQAYPQLALVSALVNFKAKMDVRAPSKSR